MEIEWVPRISEMQIGRHRFGLRDNVGHILVIEVKIDDSVFVLINIYNANTGSEQLHTLNDLVNILETIEDIQNKSVVLGGDFNVILNPS